MTSYLQFGKLRLVQFLPDAEIATLSKWQLMGETWVGEAVGFSEWLRLEREPEVLRSLSIDFDEFPPAAAEVVLRNIGLALGRRMRIEHIERTLGKPIHEERFVSDRISFDFLVEGPPTYEVSCTVLNDGGLTYLVVMRPLPVDKEKSI